MLPYSDKKYLLLVSLFFLSLHAISQNSSRDFRKLLWDGNKEFEIGDYLNAKNHFEQAYAIDSLNSELNYKLGIASWLK